TEVEAAQIQLPAHGIEDHGADPGAANDEAGASAHGDEHTPGKFRVDRSDRGAGVEDAGADLVDVGDHRGDEEHVGPRRTACALHDGIAGHDGVRSVDAVRSEVAHALPAVFRRVVARAGRAVQ